MAHDLSHIEDATLRQMVSKTLDVRHEKSPGALSTGEALAAALILNRPEWLANMRYTICEAIDRLDGDGWVQRLREAERIVNETP